MNCAYCNGPCDDRPVRYEAICWDCSRKHDLTKATADLRDLLFDAIRPLVVWLDRQRFVRWAGSRLPDMPWSRHRRGVDDADA